MKIYKTQKEVEAEGEKGDCIICGEPTDYFCPSCAGEDFKAWYCEKHYETTVRTGNCCRENELIYQKI